MVSPADGARMRVNGALLPQYHGQPVVLMGMVDKIDQSGMMITVRASDGQPIQVKLQEPLKENVEGLIECHGIGQSKQVLCETYVTFPSREASDFDMDSYDQAIKLIHSVSPNPWKSD
ncbi:replication protein A 14 kDa subunit-like [Palaemon carinicauda]|uniref:replication protein A 14 kDa subunit-like n=1 Tax=Palaemon carinicauda TaxID=392227 RepID=UPI0035B69CF2